MYRMNAVLPVGYTSLLLPSSQPLLGTLRFHGYPPVGRVLCMRVCVGGCKSGGAYACICCICRYLLYVCVCVVWVIIVMSTDKL